MYSVEDFKHTSRASSMQRIEAPVFQGQGGEGGIQARYLRTNRLLSIDAVGCL